MELNVLSQIVVDELDDKNRTTSRYLSTEIQSYIQSPSCSQKNLASDIILDTSLTIECHTHTITLSVMVVGVSEWSRGEY